MIYFSNVKYVTSLLGTSEATPNYANPSNTVSLFKETTNHDNVCKYLAISSYCHCIRVAVVNIYEHDFSLFGFFW
jgi:hypothetical protein